MVWHVVLLAPRSDLTPAEQERLVRAFERAAGGIPAVRRAHAGRLLAGGPSYAAAGPARFPYAAVLEFDDATALREYLAHPAHADLGRQFNDSLAAAVVCDYEMGGVEDIRGWLRPL